MKITVYTTETCGYCRMLKSWLQAQGIEYTEHKVDQNPFAAQTMVNLSGQMGVPFSTIENDKGEVTKVLGFNIQAFEQALQDS